jgi:hypothetical protein
MAKPCNLKAVTVRIVVKHEDVRAKMVVVALELVMLCCDDHAQWNCGRATGRCAKEQTTNVLGMYVIETEDNAVPLKLYNSREAQAMLKYKSVTRFLPCHTLTSSLHIHHRPLIHKRHA